MSRNLQPGIHPDADQLSVFVEGAATPREQEKMLAHLAECAECRKAVFLMQPHEETPRPAITPAKQWASRGFTWRWLVPVGLPAAALACALVAVLIYFRPHSGPQTPQQMASVRSPESKRRGASAPSSGAEADRTAPTSNLEPAAPAAKQEQTPPANSQLVARSTRPKDTLAPSAPAKRLLQQESPIAGALNQPSPKAGSAIAGITSQPSPAAPSSVGGPVTTSDAALAQNTISSQAITSLPLNARNFTDLQQLPPADKGAASQNASAKKKELPDLQIQGASRELQTLAGVSGRITDRAGAVIAGVTVTARDAAGNVRQTTTGADGTFHLSQLQAGEYELTAMARGFRTSRQSIELKPSEMAMAQPVLDVGAASETVEVTAASGATAIQTESANVTNQVVMETRGAHRAPPSKLPLLATVSQGKRVLSLDDAGNLFLSRDEGRKWKKIKPQWVGKAVSIESTAATSPEASARAKDQISGAAVGDIFHLTTDIGTTWSSKDGLHWHQP